MWRFLCNVPIYTGHVNNNINHITAQLVTLHIYRGTIGGDINF